MPKVEPLNYECYTPRVILAEMLEQQEDMEILVAIVKDNKGTMKIACSHLRIEDLCFFHKALGEYLDDRMSSLLIDTFE